MRFKEFYLTESTIGNKFEETIAEYLDTGKVETYPEMAEATEKVCKFFLNKENMDNVEAEHLGDSAVAVSEKFAFLDPETEQKVLAGKSKPKTDIIVTQPKPINLSLKAGNRGEKSQIMSSGKTESMALFFAVFNENKNKYLNIEGKVLELSKTIQKEFQDRFKASKDKAKEVQEQTKELNDKIQVYLDELFENTEFHMDIIKEALSGHIKFSSTVPTAAAYKLLGFTNDGAKISYHDILNDNDFIDRVRTASKFRISYKSDKDKIDPEQIHFRTSSRYETKFDTHKSDKELKAQEQAESTNWNDYLIKEYKYLKEELSLLNEDDNDTVLQKIWNFFKNVFNNLIKWFKKGFDYFCDYIGIIPNIEADGVDFSNL